MLRPVRTIAAYFLTAGLLFQTGCTPAGGDSPLQDEVLTIGTADSGGTMYLAGRAIAQILEENGLKITVSASSGSAMNAENLLSGEVDLAMVSGDTALRTEQGTEKNRLRAVGTVFFSQSNWIVPADSKLEYVHDLAGLRLGVGPENSSTEHSALTALKAAGLGEQDVELINCGLGEGTEKLRRGEVDAIHGFSGAPIVAPEELARQMPCRVLKYTPEELDAILSDQSVFLPGVLPAGTYRGQDEEIATFGAWCLLCVEERMDEELVYRLTQALWEGRRELAAAHPAMAAMAQEDFLRQDLPIPLHPGAERFYNGL